MKIFTLGYSASANSRPRGTASAILPLTLITIIRSNETLLVVLMEILRLFRRNAFFFYFYKQNRTCSTAPQRNGQPFCINCDFCNYCPDGGY